MLDIHQWVILLLVAAFVAQDTTAGPQLLVSEPLVAGPLAGWVLGDFSVGLAIGVAVQLIWSGAVPAGSARFLDVNVGTVCAVAAAIGAGKSPHGTVLSLVWLLPVGLLGSVLTAANRRINGRIVASVRPQSDGPRLIACRHLAGWAIAGLRGAVMAAIGIPLGVVVVRALSAWAEPYVNPALVWSAVIGAGAGAAVGVTWRYGRGKAAAFGALAAFGLWLAGMHAGY
jgi:mannose/fructose/N-acetylgalactosamine-specific phosphotransferase system component IIC